jgi:hypothetical protein
MTTTLMIYGSIPSSPEEAQERARLLVVRHARTIEEQREWLQMLGLAA